MCNCSNVWPRPGIADRSNKVVTHPLNTRDRRAGESFRKSFEHPLKTGRSRSFLSVLTPSVVGMEILLDDLDAAGCLAVSSESVRVRRLAEVRDLEVLSHWAVIHSEDPNEGPDGGFERQRGNVLRTVGGEGTPGVQDFCLGEIAMTRGTGVTATVNALADVLDLQHRLPNLWAVLRTGAAEVFIARRVAKLSRHLPHADVWVVDVATAAIITLESGGRVLEVAEAKIIEANPGLHDDRVETERRRRYVGYGRRDELGLQTVIARIEAGDAQWIRATIERVVEIITPHHEGLSIDEIRAIAFGYLARPAELLQLLLEHTDPADAEQPDPEAEPTAPNRALAFPVDLLDALRRADLAKLAPRAVLYVHLHEAALLSMSATAPGEVVREHHHLNDRLAPGRVHRHHPAPHIARSSWPARTPGRSVSARGTRPERASCAKQLGGAPSS